MKRWEHLEDYVGTATLLSSTFSAREYAAGASISVQEATRNIQAYLTAQRGVNARTAYVLRRAPGTRTRSARWAVGKRVADARAIGSVFNDDVKAKALRAFEPDLTRIATVNPRAAAFVERQLKATLDGALTLLTMAAQGMAPDEEEARIQKIVAARIADADRRGSRH